VADALSEARTLYAELSHHLGKEAVFLDKKHLQAGMDWPEEIASALGQCSVLLMVVKNAEQWAGVQSDAPARIQNPNDWVRKEIETALQRGLKVMPILFDGATWPPAQPLPESLQPLLTKQGKKITQEDLESDALALSVALRPFSEKAKDKGGLRDSPLLWVLLLAAVAVCLLFYGIGSHLRAKGRLDNFPSEQVEKQNTAPADQAEKKSANTTALDRAGQLPSVAEQTVGTAQPASQPPSEPKPKPATPTLPLLVVKVSNEAYNYFFQSAASDLLQDLGIKHRTNGPQTGSKIMFTVSLLRSVEASDLSEQASYSLQTDLSMRDNTGAACFSKSYRNKKSRVSRPKDTESQFTRLILTPAMEEIAAQIRNDKPRPCRE